MAILSHQTHGGNLEDLRRYSPTSSTWGRTTRHHLAPGEGAQTKPQVQWASMGVVDVSAQQCSRQPTVVSHCSTSEGVLLFDTPQIHDRTPEARRKLANPCSRAHFSGLPFFFLSDCMASFLKRNCQNLHRAKLKTNIEKQKKYIRKTGQYVKKRFTV